MRYLLIFILYFVFGCTSSIKDNSKVQVKDSIPETTVDTILDAIDTSSNEPKEVSWKDIEVMDSKDIKYQGKLPLVFSVSDFVQCFGEKDSTQSVFIDPPCNDGYFWYKFDGSQTREEVEKINQYWFKDGSKYQRYADSVVIENFKFSPKNFITYRGKRFDSNTTLQDLQKIFPNAVKSMGTIPVYEEGDLVLIILKEEPNGVSDGHLRLFLKNGKLYMMHHWVPC